MVPPVNVAEINERDSEGAGVGRGHVKALINRFVGTGTLPVNEETGAMLERKYLPGENTTCRRRQRTTAASAAALIAGR